MSRWLRKLRRAYRESPAVRFVSRAALSGAGGYVAGAINDGVPLSAHGLYSAVVTAVAYAIVGYATPLEPFVGKKARVEVPVPPADPEPSR